MASSRNSLVVKCPQGWLGFQILAKLSGLCIKSSTVGLLQEVPSWNLCVQNPE